MKTRLTLTSILGLCLVVGSLVAADKPADDKESFVGLCPISGTPALKENVHDYKGKKLYTCCPNCIKFLLRHEDDYTGQVHHQWLQTGQITQVACPLTGRPVNPKKVAEVAGAKVPLCCGNCLAKVKGLENEVDKIELVFATLDKGFTLQTKCPVSGRAIDPQQVLEHDGKQVYFCCSNCPSTFEGNPEKYVSKLPQFQQDEDK